MQAETTYTVVKIDYYWARVMKETAPSDEIFVGIVNLEFPKARPAAKRKEREKSPHKASIKSPDRHTAVTVGLNEEGDQRKHVSRAVSSAVCPPPPPLPLELWIEILGYLTDKEHLPTSWQSCRRVSRLLKAAAEKAYLYVCIRKWKVHLKLGYRRLARRPGQVEGNGRRSPVTALLRFQKLAYATEGGDMAGQEGQQRVYFHDPEMQPPPWGLTDEHLDDDDTALVVRCGARGPLELVVGSGAYNRGSLDVMLDIPNPGASLAGVALRVDRDRRTVSCLWQPLLSTFLCNAHEGNPYAFYGTYGKKKPGRIVRGV
ncbi:hypothetical protein G7054_g13281 [Neopestalotiopsis clavispora]|nr:hypothetical protein G7054_g13281 [Neopestalotiopsis clavispora]